MIRHRVPYRFDLFDNGRDLLQERQICRHLVRVFLRLKQVFVRVDDVLIEELNTSAACSRRVRPWP
ncbi:hypothetical protein [Rhizobium sp. Rhizsp82]|uniref:hypothetical protein n=1 Tax=Rhizobium sp. Rhizsp82 TaxID=3243057 RepID=UPI0039B3E999